MSGLAQINIKFAADLKSFSSGIQNANRSIAKMSKKLQSVGTALSIGVTTPLTAFAAVSLKNWDKQAKAIAQVETGLLTTGNAVGYTSEQLQKMASDLQNNSLFGDEDILQNATAQLLTFTNITGEQFGRTQQAALDLATRLDGDLKSASIQLGKALNDPVANLSALSKSGIQFSEDQKATINSLVETNRLADAQTIILDELAKQYGNSAEAAAKAGLGGLKQLSNAFGDLQEEFGAIIAQAILPLVDHLKGMVSAFQGLSPETKKWIVILGGVAAAAGPILALAGTILPMLMTGFTLLTGPIGLIVAGLTAIGVVIYKNWAPIKAQLVEIANYFIDLYNESSVFRIAVESVVLTFKNLWEVGKFALNAIWSLLKGLSESFVNNFKLIGSIIKAVFTGNFSEIGGIVEKFKNDTSGTFLKTVSNLGNDWSGLMTNMQTNTQDAFNNISKRAKVKLVKENVDVSAIAEKAKSIAPVVVPTTSGTQSRPEATALNLAPVGLNLTAGLDIEAEKLDTTLQTMQESMSFFQENSNIFTNAIGSSFMQMGNQIAAVFQTGNAVLDAFVGSIINSLAELGAAFLQQLIVEKLFATGKKSIDAGKASSNAIVVASSAAAAMGPAGIFALPGLIASQLGVIGASFASIAAFENGGIVGGNSFTGDKLLARINSGEMILNKKQQRNVAGMINPAAQPVNVNLTGGAKISMRQLIFEIRKEEKMLTRTQA
jgi:hypothetical protein